MAYENGIAVSQVDLLTKLYNFAGANGWTQGENDAGNKRMALSKDGVFVQFRWDAVDAIAIYQSLGFSAGVGAGLQTGDSGSGQTGTAAITTDRRINRIGTGPYTSYHFFLGAVGTSDYIHVVLEVSPGLYRHISFGELIKDGSWIGGEYCCGTVWATSGGGDSGLHNVLVDHACANFVNDACTIHMEGVAGDAATSKWGVNADNFTVGNDRAGNARLACLGGWRDGFFQHAMGWIQANPNNGYVPMWPLHIYRRKNTSPQQWHRLGTVPDLRFINIAQLVPGDEFTVGADTWKVFPWIRKRFTPGSAFVDETGNLGLAVKKIA